MLQSTESQRDGHDLVTEQQQQQCLGAEMPGYTAYVVK